MGNHRKGLNGRKPEFQKHPFTPIYCVVCHTQLFGYKRKYCSVCYEKHNKELHRNWWRINKSNNSKKVQP